MIWSYDSEINISKFGLRSEFTVSEARELMNIPGINGLILGLTSIRLILLIHNPMSVKAGIKPAYSDSREKKCRIAEG